MAQGVVDVGGVASARVQAEPRAGLSRWQQAAYGVGGITSGLKAQALGVYIMLYYVDVMRLDPKLAGLAIMASRVWDAISDPLIGQWSDRSRHPRGRRRVFMMRAALPFAICFWAIWAAPQGVSQGALAVYLGVVYIALYTCSTVFTVPYYALGAEISEDYDERTSISGWRTVFYNVGALLGGLLPAVLIFRGKGEALAFGWTPPQAWFWIGGIFAAAILVACLIPCWLTREPDHAHDGEHPPIWKALRVTLTNRPFLVLLFASFIMTFAWAVVGGLLVLIAKYWLNQGAHIKFFLVAQIVAGLASIPVWVRLSAATSKRTAYRVVLNVLSLVFISAYWMSPDRLWLTYLLMAFGGTGVAGNTLISTALIADICDVDELQTGRRREANFYSVQWFLIKFPGALGAASVGFILALIGFVPEAEQSAFTIEGFRFFFGPFVALLFAIGALVFTRFPLTREMHHDVRIQLDARRNAA